MFWLAVLFLLGVSYLFYRYNAVSNKRMFFRSPLFRSLAGSISILLIAVVGMNVLVPHGAPRQDIASPVIEVDTLAEEIDTTITYQRTMEISAHYSQIKLIRNSADHYRDFMIIQSHYERFASSSDAREASLGNLCLGMIEAEGNDNIKALAYYDRVDDSFPYLHFCKAELLLLDDKEDEAVVEYERELENPKGNQRGSCLELLRIYHKRSNYKALTDLLSHDFARDYFSDELYRHTLLYNARIGDYAGFVIVHVFEELTWAGFFAALVISAVWMIYIFRLSVFRALSFAYLLGMFLLGALFVFLVLPFSDLVEIYTSWTIDGGFFNDLFYCIFIIGVPEEFVKILPLLLVLVMGGKMKDPMDFILLGVASALGFAFVENLLYFQNLSNGIIHGRAYLSVLGHMADTSFVAYGIVLGVFKEKSRRALLYLLPISFLIACVVHGIYDFLLFHEQRLIFFVFFIFIIQLWIIVINNCLNNSSRFSYRLAHRTEQLRLFVTLALTAVFAFEYVVAGFSSGVERANHQLLGNLGAASFMIVFFSTNLSSFDLVKGYWRRIRLVNREKRGYGGRRARSLLTSWYFVNAVQAHNYVGRKVIIYADPYNKNLTEVLDGEYAGKIVNRITLYDDDGEDTGWFLIRMDRLFPFTDIRSDYILVKLRFQEDSLLYEDEVHIFFKSIADSAALRHARPDKNVFPFHGWAYMQLDPVEVE